MDERTREYGFEHMAQRSARCATLAAIHLVTGESAGRMLMLDAEVLTLGRSPDCDLQFPVDGVSRRHARIQRSQQNQFTISDTGSTNGLFVNGFATQEQVLKDGDRIALGPNLVISFRTLMPDEAAAMETLSASRSRDSLTGALQLAYFEEMLRFELELGQKRGFDVALICLELVGVPAEGVDEAARKLCHFLEERRKPGSLLGRLGPQRFGQTLAYVAAHEVDKAVDALHHGLRETFADLKLLYGQACSRDLATPHAAAMLERASRLTRVS